MTRPMSSQLQRASALAAAIVLAGTALGVAGSAAFRGTPGGRVADPAGITAAAPAPPAPSTTATTTTPTSTPAAPGSGLTPIAGAPVRAGSPRASAPPVLVGPVPGSEPVTFALTLRMADDATIDAYLAGLSDPGSPNYRQFLSASEFGAKFGQPLARIGQLTEWAAAQGFDVLGGFEQRTAIRLQSSAARLSDVLGVQLAKYRDDATGTEFHVPTSAEHLPAAISDAVVGLSGLDTRPAHSSARELVSGPHGAVPVDGLGPVDLAKAYDIVPLYEAGLLGDGQTVAVVSFDTFTQADIDTYDQEFGIDGPAVEKVAVGSPITKPGDGTVEVALDIEVLRAIAPHAQILNFEHVQGGSGDMADILDAIVQDGRADIVSNSWGVCDTVGAFSKGTRERGLRTLQAMAAAGISMFTASGDHGAFDCWASDPSDHRLSVDFPSANPNNVAVGGTQLSVRTDGTYLSEAGWEDYLTTGGGGGGNNPTEPRPSWQVGLGVDNEFSNGKRQSPDVSASAAVDSPYQIFYSRPGAEGRWSHVYGTSAAAPFWAGSMLLIRQLADQQGVGRLGFVTPMLYAIFNSDQRAAVFHDVTRGGNLQHAAGPGWDYATGLGSPDVTALAGAIVSYLRDHPAGG
jgi:kumamolisin